MNIPVTPVRTYLGVAALLMALLILTVVVADLNLGPAGPFVALSIAMVKAGLVATWFMHLRHAAALTRLFALSGVALLAILIGLTLTDYLSRA